MVEGAPLLREYGPKAHRGFESLRLRQSPLAQTDQPCIVMKNALLMGLGDVFVSMRGKGRYAKEMLRRVGDSLFKKARTTTLFRSRKRKGLII